MCRPTMRRLPTTHHPDRLDVLADAQGQGLAPYEPGRNQPADEGDDDDEEHFGGVVDGDQGDEEEQDGDGQEDVDDAHGQ